MLVLIAEYFSVLRGIRRWIASYRLVWLTVLIWLNDLIWRRRNIRIRRRSFLVLGLDVFRGRRCRILTKPGRSLRAFGFSAQNYAAKLVRIGFGADYNEIQAGAVQQLSQDLARRTRTKVSRDSILLCAGRNRDLSARDLLNLKQNF